MSRLIFTADREKRIQHTLKHFFNLAERFWELTGDFDAWLVRWQALRTADALDPKRTERVDSTEASAAAMHSGYSDWFAIAEKTVAHAQSKGQVFLVDELGTQLFVGHAGLLAFAHAQRSDYILHTCYRCTPKWRQRQWAPAGSRYPWEDLAWRKAENKVSPVDERAAVRRAFRRALLDREADVAVPPRPLRSTKEPAL